MKNKQLQNRWLIYILGMLVQNFGLYLNARSGLGTSALLAVAYVGGIRWGISFGDATIVIFSLYILAQFLVRGKKRQWRDLLQLPVTLFIGEIFNLLDLIFPVALIQSSMVLRVVALLCAMTFNGIGATLAVNMRLMPSPGDGIVQALADRTGLEMGKMKRIADCTLVVCAAVLSFALFGRLEGVGIGTIASALINGTLIHLFGRLYDRLFTFADRFPWRHIFEEREESQ